MHPLADLYINLLSEGKCRSLTIIPSIPNALADLIIDPIFRGSVTCSKAIKLTFLFLLFKTYSLSVISSSCSTSATRPW